MVRLKRTSGQLIRAGRSVRPNLAQNRHSGIPPPLKIVLYMLSSCFFIYHTFQSTLSYTENLTLYTEKSVKEQATDVTHCEPTVVKNRKCILCLHSLNINDDINSPELFFAMNFHRSIIFIYNPFHIGQTYPMAAAIFFTA